MCCISSIMFDRKSHYITTSELYDITVLLTEVLIYALSATEHELTLLYITYGKYNAYYTVGAQTVTASSSQLLLPE